MNDRSKPDFARRALSAVCFAICSLMLAGALFGCTGQPATVDTEEKTLTASEYMVKLNQAAESLHQNMNAFAVAVASGDLATLQSKANSAFQAIDELSEYKTPDELANVRKQYDDAIITLHTALNEYIAVYTDIQNEPDPYKIDMQKYAQRFENIQIAYDNGMNLLEQADAAAKEL